MTLESNSERRELHTLSLTDRKTLELHGVTDIDRFDESEVLLETICGTLAIVGENLHVQTLNLEEKLVIVTGQVRAMEYSENEPKERKRGLFGRMFG